MEKLNDFNADVWLDKSQKKLIELVIQIGKKRHKSDSGYPQKVHQFSMALLNLSTEYRIQKEKQERRNSAQETLLKISKQAKSLRLLLLNLPGDQTSILDQKQRQLFGEIENQNAAMEEVGSNYYSHPINHNDLIGSLIVLNQASEALSKKGTIGRKKLLIEHEVAKKFLFICHRYNYFQVTVSNSICEKKKAFKQSTESEAVQFLSAVFETGGDSAAQATRSARTQLRKLRKGFNYFEERLDDEYPIYEDEQYWINFKETKYYSLMSTLPNFKAEIEN